MKWMCTKWVTVTLEVIQKSSLSLFFLSYSSVVCWSSSLRLACDKTLWARVVERELGNVREIEWGVRDSERNERGERASKRQRNDEEKSLWAVNSLLFACRYVECLWQEDQFGRAQFRYQLYSNQSSYFNGKRLRHTKREREKNRQTN